MKLPSEITYQVIAGTIYFVGAGPGAPDLITVRGRDIIARADLIVYADSLVEESVANLSRKPNARVIGSSSLHLEQLIDVMTEASQNGEVVARVHSGDPSLYGAIHEQMTMLEERRAPYEIIPGVTAAFAAAARLKTELTVPNIAQTIILTRAAGRTPVPERENLRSLAAHGASLAIYLSIGRIEEVVQDLLESGAYSRETSVAILHKVTWPDESLVFGTLADIAEKVKEAGYEKHALILISPTLDASLKSDSNLYVSHLYRKTYAHRFRKAVKTADTPSVSEACVIAVTRAGADLAVRIAANLNATAAIPKKFPFPSTSDGILIDFYGDSIASEIQRRWSGHRHIIVVAAMGVVIRAIAPMLGDKRYDPGVVCLDEAGRSVIPLIGGHQSGANDIACRIAEFTGGHAAITTASDVQGKPALDGIAAKCGWRLHAGGSMTHVMACLVNDEPIGVYLSPDAPEIRAQASTWLDACENFQVVPSLAELAQARWAAGIIVTPEAASDKEVLKKSIVFHPPTFVIGVGCRRGVPVNELYDALAVACADANLAVESVAALATVDLKANEPGICALAEKLGVPLRIIAQERLRSLDPKQFSPSAAQEKFDIPGVAEPCATLIGGGDVMIAKRSFERCTIAAVRIANGKNNVGHKGETLSLVGIGPGGLEHLTPAARNALSNAEILIGYQYYLDLLGSIMTAKQEIIPSPIGDEMTRARQAVELAAAGRRVALVSGGDIGVYAMAAPVFEVLRERNWQGDSPKVETLPGVSAVQSVAARLGAPIGHDFCLISLSDLLTPWEVIERRVRAASRADFVVAFYNPRSRERNWQLARSFDILRAARADATPVAFARNVTRPDEAITLTTLAEADVSQVDMFTLVLVGCSKTYIVGGRMATPRGYSDKERPFESFLDVEGDGRAVSTYPISLTHMRGARALIVGGGSVAERKVKNLLSVGAKVRLISPEATAQICEWARKSLVHWDCRTYQNGDLTEETRIVFAATNQRSVNALVAAHANILGILCNVVDNLQEGDFHTPAVHRDDGLTVAVSTDGESPTRARMVRNALAEWLKSEVKEPGR